jgi:lipopolysaccharide/colanic/teichoic acid biosynthesis glycosyltransferase
MRASRGTPKLGSQMASMVDDTRFEPDPLPLGGAESGPAIDFVPIDDGIGIRQIPWTKRLFDVLFAATALVALAPLLLLLMLAIVVESWGSPIFSQERVGIGGRRFRMLKLRSMVPDAESRIRELAHLNEVDGPLFKIRQDPRRTRVGRALRATSLDELPQLVNVLRGEMSLVGPRPPLPREVVYYTREQLRRLSVIPGLTGAWQVSGRSTLDWGSAIGLDLDYIDNWSFGLDLKLIWKTFGAVASSRGAY